MTLFNLPFQEKEVFERKHFFWHISRNVPFLFVPCQILLRQCPETFFRRPKRVFLRPKGIFKRPCRTRPDEDSLCTFFESSSLKTRFSSKNAKILDPKQKRRKKRSLETQGIYIHTLSTFSDIHVQSCYCLCRLDLGDSSTLASPALNTGHLHFSTFQQAWSGGVLLGMFRDLRWCTPPLRGSWSRQRCPSVGPRRAPGPEPIECLGSNQSLGFEGCERSFWVSFTVHGVVLDIDMPGSPSLPMDRTVYKSVPMVSLYVPS